MWSKELKKKKRISADTVQTFGPNNGLSSNSSGGSNSSGNLNLYGSNVMASMAANITTNPTSSIPLVAGDETVNTSNLLNLTATSVTSTGANKSNGSNGITGC
jgi:hypothetical protein